MLRIRRPTFKLTKSLLEKQVPIKKIVGYDISQTMIKSAQEQYNCLSLLTFMVQDVEKITAAGEYDIAISLFGFHWVNDINKFAKTISNLLKSSGKLFFLVPIEKMDLFDFRLSFMNHSLWKECFDKEINPFINDHREYTNAFDKYFHTQKSEKIKSQKK